MKKLLLASTALVATAGVASAEVTLTGMAEMGIYNPNSETSESQFFTDIDVTFTMTGETDNGISFGASIDLDESDGAGARGSSNAFGPSTQGGETIFVSYGGATLTMGDTDGAYDSSIPEMALAGGSLADDETAHIGFDSHDGINQAAIATQLAVIDDPLSTPAQIATATAALVGLLSETGFDGAGDGQVARFDYTYSSFVFSLSAEQLNNGDELAGFDATTAYGLGVKYSAEMMGANVTAGLGYQSIDDIGNSLGMGVTATLSNGFSVGVTGSRVAYDDDLLDKDLLHRGIAVGYEMGNLAVGLNYGKFIFDDVENTGTGLAATYDLGGGLEFRGGYGHNNPEFGDDYNTYSLGLRMNF